MAGNNNSKNERLQKEFDPHLIYLEMTMKNDLLPFIASMIPSVYKANYTEALEMDKYNLFVGHHVDFD